MDFKEAEKITSNYGGFVEWIYFRLKPIFWNKIPKSLLPYSIEYIEEALNIVAKSYHEKGDQKMVKNIQETQILLVSFVDDEEAILNSAKMLKDKKWFDGMLKIVQDFRQLYGEPKHISGFFKDTPMEKVDFENPDYSTAHSVVEIYSTFLKYAHMRLSFIFCQKIPESFLPLPKEYIHKSLDSHANLHELFGQDKSAELFNYSKTILGEDYVDDETAINEMVKNFSGKETRDSIISDLIKFQLTSARLDYINILGYA